jgi:uncharacterized membrane protein
MRRVLLVAVLAVLIATPVLAQSDVPGVAPASASLTHSALKATTFKVGSTAANLGILSYAAGGIVGGAGLTTFMLGSSWLLYTANDYLWDAYAPPPVKQTEDQGFDATADVWRNTWKFATYKPVIASVKFAALYAYTSSAAITAVFGTASVLTNTAVFYLNNVAWDAYDWYGRAPTAVRAGG